MGQFHNNSYQTLTTDTISYSNDTRDGISIISMVIIGILIIAVLVFIVYFARVVGKQDNTRNSKVDPE